MPFSTYLAVVTTVYCTYCLIQAPFSLFQSSNFLFFFLQTLKFHAGKNVGLGKDYTIFSLIDGVVKFEKYGPDRKKVK